MAESIPSQLLGVWRQYYQAERAPTEEELKDPEKHLPKKDLLPGWENARVVFCFGAPRGKFAFLGSTTRTGPLNEESRPAVTIWNHKVEAWEDDAYVDYLDTCLLCGSKMRVFVIQGTTWFALCSKECREEFDRKKRELGGDFTKTLHHYMDASPKWKLRSAES